jgi:hypothetical protein
VAADLAFAKDIYSFSAKVFLLVFPQALQSAGGI